MKTAALDFFKDAGAIISSVAYSRYNKTQVFPANSDDGITRRWLHVQLVSYHARQLCRELGLNEDLAEAIALGHDMGHPPYGHAGEDYLNRLCMETGCGFFVHHAQSVRLLTVIENQGKGLRLSMPVLDGILCHNGEALSREYVPDYVKPMAQFEAELNGCFKVAHINRTIRPATLEGCVVRASDIIAYIGRDIEDAIKLGLINRGDIPNKISAVLGDTEALIREALIDDVVRESYGAPVLTFSEQVFQALKGLLAFNYVAIYAHTVAEAVRREQEFMFHMLFHACCGQLQRDEDAPVTRWVQTMDELYSLSTSIERMVVDYIACMTEEGFERAFAEIMLSN